MHVVCDMPSQFAQHGFILAVAKVDFSSNHSRNLCFSFGDLAFNSSGLVKWTETIVTYVYVAESNEHAGLQRYIASPPQMYKGEKRGTVR